MPHRFTQADGQRLAGVWSTFNRRTYCAWMFEPTTRTLKSRRGTVVRAATLKAGSHSLEELRDKLPKLALEMVNGQHGR